MKSNVADGLLGLCVADALGVPVEFNSRLSLQKNPVVDMRGYGTYNQPPGTWSDDSSLAFCLAESLVEGLNLNDMAKKFCMWLFEAHWTPHGKVFDIGHATKEAIFNLKKGVTPVEAGGKTEHHNGNGSLMRILPLAYYLLSQQDKKIDVFECIHNVSSLTHAHPRSHLGCSIYLVFAMELIQEKTPKDAYCNMQQKIKQYYQDKSYYQEEIQYYERILNANIWEIDENKIETKGYVVFTLEAALWCFFTTNNYQDCVLKAINLGEDTDTTAAVAGGLAGVYYGQQSIPAKWLEQIACKAEIINLAEQLQNSLFRKAL